MAEAGGAVGPFAGGPPGPVSLDRPVFIAAATPALLERVRGLLPPEAA